MPQRFLRPGITTSQRYNACSWEAQSLFLRLVTLVDDFGRYDAETKLIRSHAFPFGDPLGKDISLIKLELWCQCLSLAGLAIFYIAPDGKRYVQLVRWQERARADKSKYPAFDNTCQQMFSNDNKCSPPSPSPSPSPLHHRHSSNGSSEPSEPTDDIWLAELCRNPAYEGIDVRREHGKMLVWCQSSKKLASRRRFVNWLNKCERPLRAVNFKRQEIDPAKITVAPEFKTWASEKYPKRQPDIEKYKTWADVPEYLRGEWKREKITPLTEMIAQ